MSDAHFFLHHHPQQEVLADLLLDKLEREGLGKPFHQSTVLVRNQGMGTWIKQRMAKKTGIAMQIDFPQPNAFLKSILQNESVSPDELRWKIYLTLPQLAQKKSFTLIRDYLDDEQQRSSLKRYQLAGQIASLFDKYLLYRPEWIKDWNEGRKATTSPHEQWQKELWLAIQQTQISHWSQSLLSSRNIDTQQELPDALHVFGISNFAPIYVHFLYQLSYQIPVHIYWMNPVEGYWGDGPTKQEWILAKAFDDPDLLMMHNPLLASFGRMGREFVHTIYGGSNGNHNVQEQDIHTSNRRAIPSSRLEALQWSLANNEPLEIEFPQEDHSVSIHSCHTPLRELETLKNHLLTLAEEQTLDAGDVLVLCPDIEAYAPAIEAVFGSNQDHSGPHLPFRISDRNSPLSDPTINAVIQLFSLHTQRFTNREALALLSTPAITNQLDLAETDIATIEEWIQRNGIHWGINTRHVREVAPGCQEAQWTWRSGLDRMLLGAAMPQDEEGVTLWNGILPFHDIEGSNTRILAALCSFVDWCSDIRKELTKERSLEQWVDITRSWIDEGFDKSPENQQQLQPMYKALESILEQAEFISEALPVTIFLEHLKDLLGDSASTRGFLTGSVTFCEMKPMRAVPARVICLLGLDHDTFPRGGSEVQFDLTKNDRREGDRSSRDDDVYFFLETLLSARESLFVSYIGKSIKDGEDRPPSTALQTLIDHTPGMKKAVQGQRLHGFDPHYFDQDHPLSHDLSLLKAAETLVSLDEASEPIMQIAVERPKSNQTITVDQFVRTFIKPAEQFLKNNLQAQRSYLDSPLEENEALQIDSLSAWQMKSTLLNHHNHFDERIEAWKQQGLVPPGEMGNQLVNNTLKGLEEILQDLPTVEQLPVSVTINGLTIHGNVPTSLTEGSPQVILIDPSEKKPARQLTVRIYQLLASLQLQQSVEGMLLGLKSAKGADSISLVQTHLQAEPNYEEDLTDLVNLYQDAQSTPLQHFPDTAEAYWGTTAKADELPEELEQRRRKAALAKWQTGYNTTGESDNDVIKLLYDISSPFTESFMTTSEIIWKPIIENRTFL